MLFISILRTLQTEMLAQRHFDGTLTVPGHPKPEAECPADLLEQPPAPPKLNVCVQREDLYPEIPDAVTKASRQGWRSWLSVVLVLCLVPVLVCSCRTSGF